MPCVTVHVSYRACTITYRILNPLNRDRQLLNLASSSGAHIVTPRAKGALSGRGCILWCMGYQVILSVTRRSRHNEKCNEVFSTVLFSYCQRWFSVENSGAKQELGVSGFAWASYRIVIARYPLKTSLPRPSANTGISWPPLPRRRPSLQSMLKWASGGCSTPKGACVAYHQSAQPWNRGRVDKRATTISSVVWNRYVLLLGAAVLLVVE